MISEFVIRPALIIGALAQAPRLDRGHVAHQTFQSSLLLCCATIPVHPHPLMTSYDLLSRTTTTTYIATAAVALGVGYSIKRFFTPSPLAAIPGPPSPSFLTGHYKPLVAAPDSIHYARKVSEEYGGVVRLSTGFKVSATLF